MTDNDIIKALNGSILNAKSIDCKVWSLEVYKLENTLNLIDRQKAEIESLKHRKTELQIRNQELQREKSEAIKEFAEGLCDGRVSNDPVVIAVHEFAKTQKEMLDGWYYSIQTAKVLKDCRVPEFFHDRDYWVTVIEHNNGDWNKESKYELYIVE